MRGLIRWILLFAKQLAENYQDFSTLLEIKHFFAWKQSMQAESSPIQRKAPWITYRAISIIDEALTSCESICEFGGGGSTLFFLIRRKKVITIEHDPHWAQILEAAIPVELRENWTLALSPPSDGPLVSNPDPSNPDHYVSSNSLDSNFRNYATQIDRFPDGHFDLVLIDGRARPSCLKHATKKIKRGGLLVLDNAERTHYQSNHTEQLLAEFDVLLSQKGATPHCFAFTQTNIWRRRSQP